MDDDPSMIAPHWSWVAAPFWWLVALFYLLIDIVTRRNREG